VHQHDLAGADARDVLQQQRGGGERAARRGRLRPADPGRDLGEQVRVRDRDLGQTAAAHEGGHGRPRRRPRDPGAERPYRPRDREPGHERPIVRVARVAATRHDVDEVHAGRDDIDRHLPAPGCGTAMSAMRVGRGPVEDDGAHQAATCGRCASTRRTSSSGSVTQSCRAWLTTPMVLVTIEHAALSERAQLARLTANARGGTGARRRGPCRARAASG
jgi:hypothetical protein